MAIFKDIEAYTQKSAVAGTEKLPVSDTEFITPDQIAGMAGVLVGNSPYDFAISDENGYCIVAFRGGQIRTKNFDSETVLTQIGDIETLLSAI